MINYSAVNEMFFFFQAEDGIRDGTVTGVQTCALPICEVNNWDDGVIPQFQQMSAAIHRHGALCLSQISHRGRRGHSWYSGTPLWAPSDTREERHREWPHVMTKAEIREVVDAWAAAAVRLKKGGYDGADIPLYGGHLLENFISPLANTRTDEYGGSLDNRLRLPTEVLRALREAVGRDFILGRRHSGDHFVEGGLTREELLEIARQLDTLGIADYWMVSGSNTETLKFEAAVTPSHYHPRGVFNDLAALTKSVVRVPVIVAGRIVTAEQAEAALAAGGCIGRLRQGKAITCIQNPAIGREAELMDIHPASSRRRVVVVGGGVAGLEAARVAALRGHQTILLEATSAVGGQVLAVARAPKREDYASIATWLVDQAKKAGAEIRLNTPASGADVLALKPDAVVLATGATQRRPDIPGVRLPHVATTVDVLTGRAATGRRVVIVDEEGYFAAPTTADFLAERGAQVTIVCRYFMVGE